MATGKKTGGRRKGTPNKTTAALKDVILGALHAVGGQRYLEGVAKNNPSIFCSLVGRLVPSEVKADIFSHDAGPAVREVVIVHHKPTAPEHQPAGGCVNGDTHSQLPSGPDAGVAVNGSLPSRIGGHP